ncbi:hypothetical protein [Desulfoluna spongiiphila]|uniref:Lipoprotein n=1 Tax=Desulfoluna spongiiphila TaxID=419481 RepID=A0A1G5CHN9_9BACT|nr:hypothetical protein [Desulfoluna spongiiphila]SCY01811.1 hypothetical protein SAMN05216233_10323 [Desulfoluna spongiiphila]
MSDRFARKYIFILVSALSIAGCKANDVSHQELPTWGTMPVPMTTPFRTSNISAHTYEYIYSYDDVSGGYGAYTYVLLGCEGGDQEAGMLYEALIKQIEECSSEKSELDHLQKNKLNIFLIPKREGVLGDVEVNYKLSKKILTSFAVHSSGEFSEPGPYLITTSKKISEYNNDEEIGLFYVDLTGMNIKAINEIVSVYKHKLIDNDINSVEKLESFKISILNLALDIEDSIGFAKVAYANFRKIFDSN